MAELPFTVAEGFAAKHGMKREVFLKRAAPRMTRLERLRTQEQRTVGDRRPDADLTVMPLTRLALYVLSLGFEERAGRRAELTGALRAAARRAAGGTGELGAGARGAGRQLLLVRVGAEAASAARRGAGLPSPAGGTGRTPVSTGGCGPRGRATRCSYARGGRPRWGCGSWTRWSRGVTGPPRTGW
ncbi:hypothetical protein SBADM41S_11696 [Streptomyces badius]